MNAELTAHDIEVLMEALEAWENKDAATEMAGMVMDKLLTRGLTPEQMQEVERDRRNTQAEMQKDRQTRKERSIMLRAKLLMIRDTKDVEQLISTVLGDGE